MMDITEILDEEMMETTDEERIELAIETLEKVGAQLLEIESWMYSDGGMLYPDQKVMIGMLKVLTKCTKRSCENRFNGEDDSASVEQATTLLWSVQDDSVLKGTYLSEA
jgi:hypothetical protein